MVDVRRAGPASRRSRRVLRAASRDSPSAPRRPKRRILDADPVPSYKDRVGKGQRALVPVSRLHVVGAVAISAFTVLGFFIDDLVRHKVAVGDVLFLIVAFSTMAAALTWANWSEENKLERQLRASRRRQRLHARPMSR